MPASITAIVRYMDELEPDRGWYDRQRDSRGECSILRGKLRRFARSHPRSLATRHWLETGKWQPPDGEALSELVGLIKTMIK
jgi:hypothetical protein